MSKFLANKNVVNSVIMNEAQLIKKSLSNQADLRDQL